MTKIDFFTHLKTGFTIYSKSNCSYCIKVKKILVDKQISFLDINCDEYLVKNKEEFLLFIKEQANKDYKTFPIVFKDGKFIGGFTETQHHFDKFLCFDSCNF